MWSIAAGPLVNLLLVPVTFILLFLVLSLNLDNDPQAWSDIERVIIACSFDASGQVAPGVPTRGSHRSGRAHISASYVVELA